MINPSQGSDPGGAAAGVVQGTWHQQPTLLGQKMAMALASPWRARILTELRSRPMSPSQFVKEIGGERSHIARCFRQLAEWGCIELMETRTGHRRRGGIEHVYRSVRSAFYSASLWRSFPDHLRRGISGTIVESFWNRVEEAVEQGTLDRDPERHISWEPLPLDARGWSELIDSLAETLQWFSSLEAQSAARLAAAGGAGSMPVTASLAAFVGPRPVERGAERIEDGSNDLKRGDGRQPFDGRLAKAFADPLRSRILTELRGRPMSPSQFCREIGGELSVVSRCFRQLADWGFIELVAEKTGGGRRGGIEHVYRSASRMVFGTDEWKEMPLMLREDISVHVLSSYWHAMTEAMESGTFDQRVDRHFSWQALTLDREAWIALTDRCDEILAWLPRLQAECADRIAASGEQPIPTIVGLVCFRSPPASPSDD